MSRVPLKNYQVTSLQEDLRVLGLLPADAGNLSEDASAVAEGKKAKKDYDGDECDKDYDYKDKMGKKAKKEEDEDSELGAAFDEAFADEDEDSADALEVEEAALEVLEAFYGLSEEEFEDLDESYLNAVERAADVLGVDLDEEGAIGNYLDSLEEEGKMSAADIAKRMRAAKGHTASTSSERQKERAAQRRLGKGGRAKKRREYARTSGGRAALKRAKKKRGRKDESVSLDSIIDRLNGLTAPLAQESEEVGTISDKIVEGYKSLFYSAQRLAQSIATELAEDDDVDQDDPRYQLGVYFEGIADDAKGLLDTIFSGGDIPMEDAIEDLQALSSDLKKGLRKADRVA